MRSNVGNSGGGVGVGVVVANGANVKAGYLGCDGAAYSRTLYAALFAEIGVIHGVGDGSTTFNVPDIRGEFIRGFDDGAGVDSGRVLGSNQAADNENHDHAMTTTAVTYGQGSTRSAYIPHASATTMPNSGSEARPRNVALPFAIKY